MNIHESSPTILQKKKTKKNFRTELNRKLLTYNFCLRCCISFRNIIRQHVGIIKHRYDEESRSAVALRSKHQQSKGRLVSVSGFVTAETEASELAAGLSLGVDLEPVSFVLSASQTIY